MSTTQTSSGLPSGSLFEHLPQELRDMIYAAYFSSVCTMVRPSGRFVLPPLLQVNRRIRQDALPYFRSCAKFTLPQQETGLFEDGPMGLVECSDKVHSISNYPFQTCQSTTTQHLKVWVTSHDGTSWGSNLTDDLVGGFRSRWQATGLDAILKRTFQGYKHLQDPTYPWSPLAPLEFHGYECSHAGPLNVVFDTAHRIAWLCAQGAPSQNSVHGLAASFVAATGAYVLPDDDPLNLELRHLSREDSPTLERMFRVARRCGYPDENGAPRSGVRRRSRYSSAEYQFGPVDASAPFSQRLVGNSLGLLLSWALYRTHEVCYYPGHREEMEEEGRPEQTQPGQPFWKFVEGVRGMCQETSEGRRRWRGRPVPRVEEPRSEHCTGQDDRARTAKWDDGFALGERVSDIKHRNRKLKEEREKCYGPVFFDRVDNQAKPVLL